MTWIIRTEGSDPLDVIGPYRRHGTIYAVSAEEQRAWARTFAARLPTPAEFDLIWQTADVRVSPHPRDVSTASLSSLHEDAAELGSIFDRRIASGKTWVQGGTSTRAVNYGWHIPSGEVVAGQTWRGIRVYPCTLFPEVDAYVIQPPGKAHGWSHVDYSQAGYCVRPARDGAVPDSRSPTTQPDPDTERWRALTLGQRICELVGFEFGTGVREIPGAQHNRRILDYSRNCRRGGRFVGLGGDGKPRWEHRPSRAIPLPLPRDEDAWCAAFRSWLLAQALLPGDEPPHGLRVSVRELCADGHRRSRLRLHSDGYRPEPGDAVIYGRNGQSPLPVELGGQAGQGHVTTAIWRDDAHNVARCIGGNERDAIRMQDRTLVGDAAPVAYIVT